MNGILCKVLRKSVKSFKEKCVKFYGGVCKAVLNTM